jgi:transcriptional activator of cad operon
MPNQKCYNQSCMDGPAMTQLRIGDWCVNPASGQISRDGETIRLDARAMRLLVCLAEHGDEVVSIDELLDQVWPGITVTADSVYQAVASLRRVLGDDPRQPRYIATVPRLGYRMIATVSPLVETATNEADTGANAEIAQPGFTAIAAPSVVLRLGPGLVLAACAVVCMAIAVGFLLRSRLGHGDSGALAGLPQKSVAVLPFADLTEGMKNGEFADGMTEELIDRLSKVPGLHVPGVRSSFYFQGKQMPVAEIARTLGVAYVVDGSVRKSGDRVRIAARLVSADNGYVIWSETYDRPFRDILTVQDDIAGEVTNALSASIDARPGD